METLTALQTLWRDVWSGDDLHCQQDDVMAWRRLLHYRHSGALCGLGTTYIVNRMTSWHGHACCITDTLARCVVWGRPTLSTGWRHGMETLAALQTLWRAVWSGDDLHCPQDDIMAWGRLLHYRHSGAMCGLGTTYIVNRMTSWHGDACYIKDTLARCVVWGRPTLSTGWRHGRDTLATLHTLWRDVWSGDDLHCQQDDVMACRRLLHYRHSGAMCGLGTTCIVNRMTSWHGHACCITDTLARCVVWGRPTLSTGWRHGMDTLTALQTLWRDVWSRDDLHCQQDDVMACRRLPHYRHSVETIGHGCVPVIGSFDLFVVASLNKLLNKRSSCQRFDMLLMWRHCNERTIFSCCIWCCTVEVWGWMSNIIPHFILNAITYQCRD